MTRIDDEHRVAKYRRDPYRDELLGQLNQMLAPVELSLSQEHEEPQYPVTFIVGVPRSGTTLLSQLLAATGAFGFISNFVARFWMAPAVGAHIEHALGIGPRETEAHYESVFGVTPGWDGPHEFGFFWERWFSFKETHKVAPEELAQVDRDALRREIAAIESVRDRPLFFKSGVCALQIRFLATMFPTSLFVVCRREPVFNAQSLLQSRQERLGDKRHWYSTRPPEYHQLLSLPYYEQIAAQIHCIMADIKSGLVELGPHRSIHIKYEDLCEQPRSVARRVIGFVEKHGCALNWSLDRIPEHFPSANVRRIDDHEFRLLQRACKKYSHCPIE